MQKNTPTNQEQRRTKAMSYLQSSNEDMLTNMWNTMLSHEGVTVGRVYLTTDQGINDLVEFFYEDPTPTDTLNCLAQLAIVTPSWRQRGFIMVGQTELISINNLKDTPLNIYSLAEFMLETNAYDHIVGQAEYN